MGEVLPAGGNPPRTAAGSERRPAGYPNHPLVDSIALLARP